MSRQINRKRLARLALREKCEVFMSKLKRDKLLWETRERIEKLILGPPMLYQHELRQPISLRVHLRWSSRAEAAVEWGAHPANRQSCDFWFFLPKSWVVEVLDAGLAVADGRIVLELQPVSRVNTPEGCEECYLARTLAYPEAPSPEEPCFVVRYGGMVARHHSAEAAMVGLKRRFTQALGLEEDHHP